MDKNAELKEVDKKICEYLDRFEKSVHPDENWLFDERMEKLAPLGEEIIKLLKTKELTYVDAYATLEYVYKSLKFMSEYTHL